jgi:hypothetical protein
LDFLTLKTWWGGQSEKTNWQEIFSVVMVRPEYVNILNEATNVSNGKGSSINLGSFTPQSLFPNIAENSLSCPINVPFCHRESCSPQFPESYELDAFSCYSQPGCCFDETLFQYRTSYGPAVYPSVPVCYRAISNPVFTDMSSSLQFHPSFLNPIAVKILQNVGNPKDASLEQYQGCAPEYSDQRWQMMQDTGNVNFLGQINYSEELYDAYMEYVSPKCGWDQIEEDECILSGCCWNAKKNYCNKPLGSNAYEPESLSKFLNAANQCPHYNPNSSFRIPKAKFDFNPANIQMWAQKFGSSGGKSCPTPETNTNCMSNTEIRSFGENWTKLDKSNWVMRSIGLQKLCEAQGCCWDSERFNTLRTSDVTPPNNTCPWNPPAPAYSSESLEHSLRGCCNYSPCVHNI